MIEICRAYSFRQQSQQADEFLRKRNARLKCETLKPANKRAHSLIEARISGINRKDASQKRITKTNLDSLKEKVKLESWKADTNDMYNTKRENSSGASYAPSEWDMELDIALEDDVIPAPAIDDKVKSPNKMLQTISANRKRDEERKQREIEQRKNEIEIQRKKIKLNDSSIDSMNTISQKDFTVSQNNLFWNNQPNVSNFQGEQIESWDFKTKIEQWKQSVISDNNAPNNNFTGDSMESYSNTPKIEIIKVQNFDVDDLISVSEYTIDENAEDIDDPLPLPELPTSSNNQDSNDLAPLSNDDLAELLLVPNSSSKESALQVLSQNETNSRDNLKNTENNNDKNNSEPTNERRCNICKLILSSSKTLQYHMEVRHLKTKSYSCNYCGANFSSPEQSRAHIKFTHFPDSLPKCKYCDKRFISLFQATMHERKHSGEKSFKCDICDHTATHMSALKVNLLLKFYYLTVWLRYYIGVVP